MRAKSLRRVLVMTHADASPAAAGNVRTVRSLPLRIAPLPGEAIDSWLEAIAYRYRIAWADLAAALQADLIARRTSWVRRLTEAQVVAISAVTGIDPTAVHCATLSGYAGIADGLDPTTEWVLQTTPGKRLCGSRFCPHCLADSGGRWKLAWRLPWTFACTEHYCLLAIDCPSCGKLQHLRSHPAELFPHPGHCASTVVPEPGAPRILCDADLSAAPVVQFDPQHPAVLAQQTIDRLLVSGTAAFGIYRDHPCPTLAVLADVRALGGCFLGDSPPHDRKIDLPADLLAEYRALHFNAIRLRRPGRQQSEYAVVVALGAVAALNVLERPSIEHAAVALQTLPDNVLYRLSFRIRQLSSALHAVHLTTLRRLAAVNQLRMRLGTVLPSRPVADASSAHLARSLPSAFWPEWSVRLAGTHCSQRRARPSLAIAVLLIGSDLPIDDASGLLGCPVRAKAMAAALNELKHCRHWDHIRKALIRLGDYLCGCEPMIDYQRRRSLDYGMLLPHALWEQICRATDSHPAHEPIARGYLLEQLRGTPIADTPVPNIDTGTLWRRNGFPAYRTPELRAALLQHGKNFLIAHGVEDEPVRWQPPTDLLRGLTLPGEGFDAMDLAGLHQLVRRDGTTVGQAARGVDIAPDVVRLLLEEHPAPAAPRRPRRSRGKARAPRRPRGKTITAAPPGPAYRRVAQALPRERLVELYELERRSLADIAAMVGGVSGQTVGRVARDYELTLRGPGRTIDAIDPDWLHEQYITQQRSLMDLARERRMDRSSLAKAVERHGILMRGPRRRDATLLEANPAVPAMLLPALIGQGGWERLQCFADVIQHCSFTEAAKSLKVHPGRPGHLVSIIERDLGRPVLIRATESEPMKLTQFGKRVLAAVHNLEENGGP